MQSVTESEHLSKPEFREVVSLLVAQLRGVLGDERTFAERETTSLWLLSEVQREYGRQELQGIADGFTEEIRIGRRSYRRHQTGTVQYYSLTGTMTITRDTYREVGVRNGPTIVPLELAAGLAEGATPALASNLAHGYAQHDMRSHCDLLVQAHRCPPPRATAERIAKAIGQHAHKVAAKVEKVLIEREQVPTEAAGVTVGLDRTSAPMAETLPEDAARAKPKRALPYRRKAPPPMAVNYRMAYVATVCVVDKHGEALKTYRYAAAACEDPALLAERMQGQVRSILTQRRELHVGIVQDGAPEMWNQMRTMLGQLKETGHLTTWHEAIDLPHLMSRLCEAFQLVGADEPWRVAYRKNELLTRYHAIDDIEQALQDASNALQPAQQARLDEHLVYIANNKDRMRYSRLRSVGLPIGSGVTESAAKNVINMRAKRSGQRWSVEGLQGVLTLRAQLKSDRLPAFWKVLSRRYVANVNNVAHAA
jgi:hypothetical protein